MRWITAAAGCLALAACSQPPPDREAEIRALQSEVDGLKNEVEAAKQPAQPKVEAELVVNDGKDSYRQDYGSAVTCEEARKAVLDTNEDRKRKHAEFLAQNPSVIFSPLTLAEATCLPR